MKNVINCRDKEDAINSATRIKAYYPFRHVAIVDMHGQWGYIMGKTMAKLNALARQGFPVFILKH